MSVGRESIADRLPLLLKLAEATGALQRCRGHTKSRTAASYLTGHQNRNLAWGEAAHLTRSVGRAH